MQNAPDCAVKSHPCAWKFRSRIGTHTDAPLTLAHDTLIKSSGQTMAMGGDDDAARNGGETAKGA